MLELRSAKGNDNDNNVNNNSKSNTMSNNNNNNNQDERALLLFEFERRVNPGVTIADTQDIRFIWAEDDPTATTGFEITIEQFNNEKIADAVELTAPSLANILSSVTGSPINYRPPQIRFFRNGQEFTRVGSEVTVRWTRPISITHIDLT